MESYDFIVKIIQDAGTLLIEERDAGFKIGIKGGNVHDIVTSVDIKVNAFLIDKIRKTFPDHSIYSEEGGGTDSESNYQWVLDPIDGSSNFSRGIPHYAVCIGLLKGGVSVAGAVYNPITKELFSFKKGGGTFLNNKRIYVSKIKDLIDSHVLFSSGRGKKMCAWGVKSYSNLLGNVRKVSSLGSSSLDICFIAAGRVEATIYGMLTTLDIASALGILIEAGGVMSDTQGAALLLSDVPQKAYMANNDIVLGNISNLLDK